MVVFLSLNAFYRPLIKKKFIKEVFNCNWKTHVHSRSVCGSSLYDRRPENGNNRRNRTLNAVVFATKEAKTLNISVEKGGRNVNYEHCCRSVLLQQQNRSFSTHSMSFQRGDEKGRHNKSYELMQFQWIIWPSLIYTIKNWVLTNLIIRPYLDRDFTMADFETGAKQAMLLVTSLLSKGKLDSLCGLVSDEAMSEIERNYSKLDSEQRQELNFASEDIYFTFPYQVGIMLDDAHGVQKRLVEITMCFHCLLGSQEIKRLDPNMAEIYKYKDRILIINYRFIKEFTKGRETDWTINVVNYFKPARIL